MMRLVTGQKKLNKQFGVILLSIGFLTSCSKDVPPDIKLKESKFDKMVQRYLSFNVPTITIDSIKTEIDYIYIDSRSKEEYNISTINGAINITTKNSAATALKNIPLNAPIIVFCSIGYRSEKLTSHLIDMGYKNTNNLYGSIFEWANRDLPLHSNKTVTNNIHTYNKKWSKWVTNQKLNKTW